MGFPPPTDCLTGAGGGEVQPDSRLGGERLSEESGGGEGELFSWAPPPSPLPPLPPPSPPPLLPLFPGDIWRSTREEERNMMDATGDL